MSIPKEPRQLMINIMYLVLTALLALNVSSEILKAFHRVDEGMLNANQVIDTSNGYAHSRIERLTRHDEEAKQFLRAAEEARRYSAAFCTYVNSLKEEVIATSGGWIEKDGKKIKLKGEADIETGSRFFVNQGKGDELLVKVETCRNQLLTLCADESPEKQAEIAASMTIGNGVLDYEPSADSKHADWKSNTFYKVPIAGVLPILTALEADAKRSEAILLNYLFSKVNEEAYPVDALSAQVVAESKYLRKGQQYQAPIFLGASSSQAAPKVFLGKFKPEVEQLQNGTYEALKGLTPTEIPLHDPRELPVNPATGRANFETMASGQQNMTGVIQVRQPGGSDLWDFYPFDFEYEAYEAAGVVIAPTGMNTLYLGIENPIEITAGNATPESVQASGCGISRLSERGKFVAKPTGNPRKESIQVSGRTADGEVVNGSMEFRILTVPAPNLYVGGKSSGTIQKAVLRAQTGVIAKNDDFVFKANYRLKSFDMLYLSRQGAILTTSSSSNRFTPEQLEIFQRANAGDQLFFSNVKVKMPGGRTKELSMNLTIL